MIKILNKLALLTLTTLLVLWTGAFSQTARAQQTKWRAGTATTDITPAEPMPMSGYGSRGLDPHRGVHQPLYAKVLVLEDEDDNRLVMITTDLIGILRELRTDIETEVQDRHGIGPDYLFMNASHTHSGPRYRETDDGSIPEIGRYNRMLRERILAAIDEAMNELAPATVSYAHAKAGFAMNRRADYSLPPTDPYYGDRYTADGPVDHDVPVLIVKDADESLKALMFGYACHSTTSGTWQINGDYPGYAQEMLEDTHPGVTAMFVLGAGADQNPHPRRDMVPGVEPLEMAELHGTTLALSVEAALNAHPRSVDGPIKASLKRVDLDFILPTREELEHRIKTEEDEDDRERAKTLLRELEDGTIMKSYDYPVQVVRMGRFFTLIALPTEIVVDYSLRLKQEIKDPAVWVAGYSNEYFGYIPSRRVLLEGGYEGGDANTSRHPGYFAPDLEERIIRAVHDLHGRLGAGGSW